MNAKPLGPIPPGFATLDGELAIGGLTASALASGGTPCFAYSRSMIEARMAALRAVMPERISIHYAIKANSFSPILELMSQLCDGLDIASGAELAMALAAGAQAARISFAGPGKTDAELEAAISAGVTLNLESEGEAERALACAERLGARPRLAIRVNPDFDLRGSGMKMGGGARPFGVDAERVPALARRIIAAGCEWRGLHIFAGSQALDAEAVIAAQGATLDLAARLAEEIGAPLPALNLGGGFGIPYFAGDIPLDIGRVGEALAGRCAALPPALAGAELAIELGRYLVGEAGVYLTRIVDRKESRGETFLVTDGGLHHQLAASGNFGTVVRRNYPLAIATRFDAEATEVANVVGCLCTPLDRLAERAALPRAEVGDLVAVFCAGAYGASASPADFLGHGRAREMLV
ncbi:MAG: pyridoxal-dependent decarboxylase, exosortase A system-associated [Altererythrobacter sp.]|nr:pyridoxal-dependent decarboxylase, exosortase A system-associated [Altererythrobacter sp.]